MICRNQVKIHLEINHLLKVNSLIKYNIIKNLKKSHCFGRKGLLKIFTLRAPISTTGGSSAYGMPPQLIFEIDYKILWHTVKNRLAPVLKTSNFPSVSYHILINSLTSE